VLQRSIASQIEFWALLGRAVERALDGKQILALASTGTAIGLEAALASVSSQTGQTRLQQHLEALPFPHYSPCAEQPGMLVRVDAEGNHCIGRFVSRRFVPAALD
jgi:hypothetical protein